MVLFLSFIRFISRQNSKMSRKKTNDQSLIIHIITDDLLRVAKMYTSFLSNDNLKKNKQGREMELDRSPLTIKRSLNKTLFSKAKRLSRSAVC